MREKNVLIRKKIYVMFELVFVRHKDNAIVPDHYIVRTTNKSRRKLVKVY